MFQYSHINNIKRSAYINGLDWLLPLLLPIFIVACSGESSDDLKESNERVEENNTAQFPDNSVKSDDRTSIGIDDEQSSKDVFSPDVLIRQLDRLVASTDAYFLRFGLTTELASILPSLDTLEERLQMVQVYLRDMYFTLPY